MGKYAAISADIVSSTSLSKDTLIELTGKIKGFLDRYSTEHDGFWGRIIKGDSIECTMSHPNEALRLALMIKCFVKSFQPKDEVENKNFKKIGLRIAIGIGEMRTVDQSLGIMDGQAIYLSGRTLEAMSQGTTSKVKNSFRIVLDKDTTFGAFDVIASFINYVLNSASVRRCETIYHRLQTNTDIDAAKIMGVTRANVNNILNKSGWQSIEKALNYFENYNF